MKYIGKQIAIFCVIALTSPAFASRRVDRVQPSPDRNLELREKGFTKLSEGFYIVRNEDIDIRAEESTRYRDWFAVTIYVRGHWITDMWINGVGRLQGHEVRAMTEKLRPYLERVRSERSISILDLTQLSPPPTNWASVIRRNSKIIEEDFNLEDILHQPEDHLDQMQISFDRKMARYRRILDQVDRL